MALHLKIKKVQLEAGLKSVEREVLISCIVYQIVIMKSK
jgi:hypothetical protein